MSDSLAAVAQRFGYRTACADVMYRLLRRVSTRCFVAVVLPPESINARSLENPHGYSCRFLTEAEIHRIATSQPEFFSAEFAARTLAKPDRCYGIFDGERLVSSGWYSWLPTSVNQRMSVVFNPDYVYMYKGWTAEAYRGQRLHALGMAKATLAYAEEGCKGVVSYVEANNFASLQSCWRLGYRKFGRVWVAGSDSRFRTLRSPGCRAYGFDFVNANQASAEFAVTATP